MTRPTPTPPRQLSQRLWRVSLLVLIAHAIAIALLSRHLQATTVPLADTAPQHLIAQFITVETPAPAPAPRTRSVDPLPPVSRPSSPSPAPAPSSIAGQRMDASANAQESQQDTARSASGTTATPAKTPPATAPTLTETVVPPSSDAAYLQNPPPSYPRLSRRLGEQGTVVLHVLISADGRAEKAEVQASSGHPRLDEAALAAIQRWRFVPGQRNGVAQAMWFKVPLRFVLD